MKTIWITSLGSSEEPVKKLMSQLKTYGLEGQGHFWKDDLKKFAWMGGREELTDQKNGMWIILGSREDLLSPDIMYGLSLLTTTVQAQKGLHFPIIILQTEGDTITSEELSTPLKGANILPASDTGLGPKLVAKVHTPAKPIFSEYHMDIYGNDQIGQWFEVRPTQAAWPGIILGVSEGEVKFQAVGPTGSLPAKTELNYPMQGLKLQMGEKEYVAWATRNKLDNKTSYFAKIEGYPESILFGPYSEDSDAEMFVIKLK